MKKALLVLAIVDSVTKAAISATSFLNKDTSKQINLG